MTEFDMSIAVPEIDADAIRNMYADIIESEEPRENHPGQILFYLGQNPFGSNDDVAAELIEEGIAGEIICGPSEDGVIMPHHIFIRDTPQGLRGFCVYNTTIAQIDVLNELKSELKPDTTPKQVQAWIEGRIAEYLSEHPVEEPISPFNPH